MIRTLIAEDSLVILKYLRYILESDSEISVVAEANNGQEAVELAGQLRPDVIIMDINMPKMDGFEATRRIMHANPRPIILISAVHDPKEVKTAFQALKDGALTVLEKPMGLGSAGYEQSARELIQTVKQSPSMRMEPPRQRQKKAPPIRSSSTVSCQVEPTSARSEIELVAIGASTGGPPVLQRILAGLTEEYPAPILIVQHITAGFLRGLAEWLEQATGFPVSISSHMELLLAGHVYLAPNGFQMGVERGRRIVLSHNETENGVGPSVSHLFRSVADVFGPKAIGILLTGMGSDGAGELKLMRERGAVTIAQDKDTSLIFGMPGEAVKIGAARYVLPPSKISQILTEMVDRKTS